MYKVLRVPPTKDSYRKAYEILKAYSGEAINISFNDFYNKIDTVYMLGDNDYYIGAAYIEHAVNENISYKFKDTNIYKLSVFIFLDNDLYHKLYDLIQTIILDKNNRIITIENVPDNIPELVNALKNNKFRIDIKEDDIDRHMYYHLPNISDKEYTRVINPLNDFEVVDAMVQDKGIPAKNKYLYP